MNPVLRKLSKRLLSPAGMADLLEKHIGDGTNDLHCKQACDALSKIQDHDIRVQVCITVRLLSESTTDCLIARRIIELLRSKANREFE